MMKRIKQTMKHPLSYVLAGVIFVVLPLFFYKPFPAQPLIGRYAIPIFKLSDGSWQTIYWIDFAILACICFLLAVIFRFGHTKRK